MPELPLGEDQAFIELLMTEDMRVRHAPDIEVITSGRLDGRAAGGAADTMKLRCQEPESPCDDRLESLGKALLRGLWARCLRRGHAEGRLRRAWAWSIVLGEKSGKLKLLPRFRNLRGSPCGDSVDESAPRLRSSFSMFLAARDTLREGGWFSFSGASIDDGPFQEFHPDRLFRGNVCRQSRSLGFCPRAPTRAKSMLQHFRPFRSSRYDRALEVGCSIGVFTRQLGSRCSSVLAIDPVAEALDQARVRCRSHSHVRFDRCRAPDQWPKGCFDLILLSEMVYYLDRQDIVALAARVRSSITPGGDIVLVHWLGGTHYPVSGDEATRQFLDATNSFALPIHQSRTSAYRLDVLRA